MFNYIVNMTKLNVTITVHFYNVFFNMLILLFTSVSLTGIQKCHLYY